MIPSEFAIVISVFMSFRHCENVIKQVEIKIELKMKKASCKKKVGDRKDEVQAALNKLTEKDLDAYYANDQIMTVCGLTLDRNDVAISKELIDQQAGAAKGKNKQDLAYEYDRDGNLVILDFTPDADLIKMSTCREVANHIQKLCKEVQCHSTQVTSGHGSLFFQTPSWRSF